ncbi:preprotein translocase subunit SecA [Staphylococcus hominis]
MKSEDKNKAILEKIIHIHQTKQPVLLITRTAEAAEFFSAQLFEQNIPNNLLIAQNVAKEDTNDCRSGTARSCHRVTSMAGRGSRHQTW